jgi:hypothetical protein
MLFLITASKIIVPGKSLRATSIRASKLSVLRTTMCKRLQMSVQVLFRSEASLVERAAARWTLQLSRMCTSMLASSESAHEDDITTKG